MQMKSIASTARRGSVLWANGYRAFALATALVGTGFWLLATTGAQAQIVIGGLAPDDAVCTNAAGEIVSKDPAGAAVDCRGAGTTGTSDGTISGVTDLTASGTISTTGDIAAGTLTTTGDVTVGGSIFAAGTIAGDTLLATSGGVVVLGGGIAVLGDGVTVANGDITVLSGKLDMKGGDIQDVGALGAQAVTTNTLTTTGLATLDSLSVTSNAAVGGTLAVDGLATFKSGVDLAGKDITSVGTITATTGNITTLNSTTGNIATLNSAAIVNTGNIQTQTLATTGKATLNSLEVTTNAEVMGNLAVGGDAEVKGKLTVAKGVTVSESFTVTPGSTIDMGGNRVQNVADPIALTDAANKGYVDAGLASAFREIDRNTQGIAIAMAMSGLALPAGKTFALGANLGFFEDKQAVAVQAAIRLNPFLTLTGGFGAGVQDAGTVGGRVGVQAAW